MSGPRLLLVEPQAVMRSAVASVATEVYRTDHGLEVHPVSSSVRAAELLATRSCELLFVALDDAGHALALLEALRAGTLKAAIDTPVVVSTPQCDARLAARLKALDVVRVLLTPYKARTVIEAVGQALGRHQSALQRQLRELGEPG